MRIKFLSFIASFFMVSFVITSCLDNDNDIEYSPDATIHAFALDTIGYGVNYKFTIDQLGGLIYNEDSLPVHADTIINKILIKTLTTASGLVTMKNTEDLDSIVNINDSIDLTKYVNAPQEGKYLKFTVWAPDGLNKKEYSITVRMHRQIPDSLNWGKEPIASNPVNGAGKQKLVIANDKILLFTENSDKVYSVTIPAASTPVNPSNYGKNWEEYVAEIPEGAKISSIVSFLNNLYLVTADGEVYSSGDGLSWAKNEALSQAHTTDLIAGFSDNDGNNYKNIKGLAGIIEEDGKRYFNFTNEDATAWSDTKGDIVPNNFPISNLSADVYSTETGVLNAIVVGNTRVGLANDTATIVWASENGKSWYAMESYYNCPKLVDPSIIHYNNAFYICGKDETKGFEKFYVSPTLLVWNGVNSMFMLPGVVPAEEAPTISAANGFSGKLANYSMIVDRNHFIWMIGGNDINEIWRGRVNKLGFIIQE